MAKTKIKNKEMCVYLFIYILCRIKKSIEKEKKNKNIVRLH